MGLNQLLTDEEVRTVIMAVMRGRGGEGVSEADLVVAVDWAREARLDGTLVGMVLRGELWLDVKDDGEVAFQAVPASSDPTRRGPHEQAA